MNFFKYNDIASMNEQNQHISAEDFLSAAENGDLSTIKKYIKQNGDIEVKTKYGRTALLLATWEGYLRIVKALVIAGANIEIKDNSNSTSLQLAKFKNHKEIIKVLTDPKGYFLSHKLNIKNATKSIKNSHIF